MKSVLIVCNDDPINLLLTNAVAKPLAKTADVYLSCPDTYGQMFVNNLAFKGSQDFCTSFDQIIDLTNRNNDQVNEYYATRDGGHSTQTLLQLFFCIFELHWAGQGYDLKYLPRNRQKKDSVGIAVRNKCLKDYISKSNIMKDLRLWDIPFKTNIIKQLDEINRCSHIITDDEVCVHAALSLRKHIEYVVPKKPPYDTEMFGSGNVHIFDFTSMR